MTAPKIETKDDILYKLHCLNQSCTNLSLLKYRDFQGFLVTGQHSGTHSRPSFPLQWGWLRGAVDFPPYALVVRRIEDVLISNYEKWKHEYKVSFSEYLKGDPRGQKYICDIWDYVYFMNRWGDVMQSLPQTVCLLRYEDFRQDRAGSLQRIAEHFGLQLSQAAIEQGAAMGDKGVMEKHSDPAFDVHALRQDGVGDAAYTDEDRLWVRTMLDKYLRHDLGYDFFDKPRGYRPAAVEVKRAA